MNEKNTNRIHITSFNCRGMRYSIKLKNVFEWLRSSYRGILLLQETHSFLTDEQKWSKEWKGKIIFSHREYNARGAAILIPEHLINDFIIINSTIDQNGRYIFLQCKIFNSEIILVNLYCPTKDKVSAQENFYVEIKNILDKYSDQKLLLGGDLNTYLNIGMDKKGGKHESQTKFSENINSLIEEYDFLYKEKIQNADLYNHD